MATYTTPETEAAAAWFEGNEQAQAWLPGAIDKARKASAKFPDLTVNALGEGLQAIYSSLNSLPTDPAAKKAAVKALREIYWLEIAESILAAQS